MHTYFNLFGISIPSYGLLISLGFVLANLISIIIILPKYKLSLFDFLILEAYCCIGGFLGAKLLYILVSYKDIDWSMIFDADYFNSLMQGGFVFYGGLIGGLLFMITAGKLHKLSYKSYLQHFVFLIPFVHCFGRIGCFMVGCCYGKPYDGVLAVTFPVNSLAPHDTSLFPVQLVEASFLIIISMIILFFDCKYKDFPTIALYLLLYSILRFIMEYFRYDSVRGFIGPVSTSQFISIIMFCVSVVLFTAHHKKQLQQQ